MILKDDVSTSLKEALPVRIHKVYCKVLCILLIHRAASMSTNELANAEHSCLDNSVCCRSLEYQNHSCQSKRV